MPKVRAVDVMNATEQRAVLATIVRGHKIVVNGDEVAQVRGTFELYLECQTIKEIDRRGWKNKLSGTVCSLNFDQDRFNRRVS